MPGKLFNCSRGVRQGDPPFPVLFVLAADMLQSIINEAARRQLLRDPISDDFPRDFPIVKYADDTLIILPGEAKQLVVLKSLLRSFADSTELHVNYDKSFLVPINMDDDRATHLVRTLG